MKLNIAKTLSIAIIALAGATTVSSCSDTYMEELNTDPAKAATIDANAQLTTALLQTYGDLGQVEIYRNYHYGFTQQLMGCWNTTNYGGRHTEDNNEMMRTWTSFYPKAIKELVDGIHRTDGDPSKVNINSALRIYRAYLLSIMTDTYGDCPASEAGLGYLEGKYSPKYDTQQDIYFSILEELTNASASLDVAADPLSGDVIYGGDVAKWRKFANSLRMRYAMRMCDVDAATARDEFEKAVADQGGIINSAADDALIKYMDVAFSFGQDSYTDYRGNALSQLWFGNDPANNPSYICSTFYNQLKDTSDPRLHRICRFYFDGLMSATSSDGRVDLTDEILTNNVKIEPVLPGMFSWDNWPAGYTSTIVTELAKAHPEVNPAMAREVRPKLASNFLKGNCPGVVMTYAEVNFLMAEAALYGWNVPGKVEDYYWTGVRAAMSFLSDNYGIDPISDADFTAFKAANPMGMSTILKKKDINTQAWIHHFTNPNECWANVRRSDFPRLLSPAEYGFGAFLTGGSTIPLRLRYPVLESSYNKSSYQEAIDRMGGVDSWDTPMWWDIY